MAHACRHDRGHSPDPGPPACSYERGRHGLGEANVDQPRASASLGTDPIRTIGRDELKMKLDRGDDFRLIMALNRMRVPRQAHPGVAALRHAGGVALGNQARGRGRRVLLERRLPLQRRALPRPRPSRLSQRPTLRGRTPRLGGRGPSARGGVRRIVTSPSARSDLPPTREWTAELVARRPPETPG